MKCKVTYIKLCYFEKLIKPKEWQGINLSGTPTRYLPMTLLALKSPHTFAIMI